MENETKVIEEQKTKKKSIIVPLLFLLAIALIAGGIVLSLNQKETPEVDNNEDSPVTENEEVPQNQKVKSIELAQETEELVVDDTLKIKFIGTSSTEVENGYLYKAEVYLNDELINDNFFTGNNIWSSNFAATFDVTKVENTYIIKSAISKQCGGTYALVLSSDKATMNQYSDVSISIDNETSQYTVIQCSDCMNETTCQNTTIDIPKLTNE